ncbi:hypothetical protein SLS54_001945 [Diplodia seriata]
MGSTGIPCTVFEQDESLDQRSRDWDFGIYWAQTPLEACLPADVRGRILTAQVDDVVPSADAFFPMFNAETGEVLHRVPTPYYLRLRRREFARVMGAGIDIRVSFYPFRPAPLLVSLLDVYNTFLCFDIPTLAPTPHPHTTLKADQATLPRLFSNPNSTGSVLSTSTRPPGPA